MCSVTISGPTRCPAPPTGAGWNLALATVTLPGNGPIGAPWPWSAHRKGFIIKVRNAAGASDVCLHDLRHFTALAHRRRRRCPHGRRQARPPRSLPDAARLRARDRGKWPRPGQGSTAQRARAVAESALGAMAHRRTAWEADTGLGITDNTMLVLIRHHHGVIMAPWN